MNTRRALAVATLVALMAACGGGQQGVGVPGITHAQATRDVDSSAAKLTSTVRVDFDRDIALAPAKVPLASYFELEVPRPGGRGSQAARVLVRTAEVPADNRRQVVLTVDSLVPAGTVLRVAKRAFQEGAEGDITVDIDSELSPRMVQLASTALAITRPELLGEPRVAEVTPADGDPAAMRAGLEAHLQQRGASAETKQKALQRFDSIPVEIVPNPKLRAALAALTGTFAEPAIDSLLTSGNCTGKPAALVAFQPPPDAPNLLARSTTRADGRRVISLNPIVEGERIEHLMPLIAHETVHCDSVDGRFEEVAATAFDTFLYIELIAVDPGLVFEGTRLARDFDVDAVAMINSGRRVPESVGLLRSPAVARALPGTTSNLPSFADLVAGAYPQITFNDSPDELAAKGYVGVLAARADLPAKSPFDLVYLDELLGRALDANVLDAAIAALELSPEG